jgi:hypothetical protein
MEENKARQLFNEANTRRNSERKGKGENPEVLDEDEFVSFYFKLLQRPEIDSIFAK